MGQNFKKLVYQACKQIPKGKITTYKEIAHFLGTKAYRAVGQVLKNNPHHDVPCFKVVKSDGSLSGYCGSGFNNIKKKIKKLNEEGVIVVNGKIDLEKYLFKF